MVRSVSDLDSKPRAQPYNTFPDVLTSDHHLRAQFQCESAREAEAMTGVWTMLSSESGWFQQGEILSHSRQHNVALGSTTSFSSKRIFIPTGADCVCRVEVQMADGEQAWLWAFSESELCNKATIFVCFDTLIM